MWNDCIIPPGFFESCKRLISNQVITSIFIRLGKRKKSGVANPFSYTRQEQKRKGKKMMTETNPDGAKLNFLSIGLFGDPQFEGLVFEAGIASALLPAH
jgi:hypothetical protein